MAALDQIGNIANVALLAFLTFQPAAGVECLITKTRGLAWIGGAPNQAPRIQTRLFDGANDSVIADGNFNPIHFYRLKLLINNSIYLRIQNTGVGAQTIAYAGIQIK